jgi:hypothetical protein
VLSVWWRLRQWIYARPRVAVGAAVVALLVAGVAGWQSARWITGDGATQAAGVTVYQVKGARTIRIQGERPRVVSHIVWRTRTVTLASQSHTMFVAKGVSRIVPTTTTMTVRVAVERRPRVIARTVTAAGARTLVVTRTVMQPLGGTVTVTQTEGGTQVPPGHLRPLTVTVTQTQTVTQAATTVTVTTSRGH